MSTKFGIDSWSRFFCSADRHTQTHSHSHRCHLSPYPCHRTYALATASKYPAE